MHNGSSGRTPRDPTPGRRLAKHWGRAESIAEHPFSAPPIPYIHKDAISQGPLADEPGLTRPGEQRGSSRDVCDAWQRIIPGGPRLREEIVTSVTISVMISVAMESVLVWCARWWISVAQPEPYSLLPSEQAGCHGCLISRSGQRGDGKLNSVRLASDERDSL